MSSTAGLRESAKAQVQPALVAPGQSPHLPARYFLNTLNALYNINYTHIKTQLKYSRYTMYIKYNIENLSVQFTGS